MSDHDPHLSNIRVEGVARPDDVYRARMALDEWLSNLHDRDQLNAMVDAAYAAFRTGVPLYDVMLDTNASMVKAGLSGISRDAVEQMLLQNPYFVKWLGSRAAARWMWDKGDPKGQPDPIVTYNDRLYTHNRDGSLNRIKSGDIARHFTPGREADWPQLVLTTNHADTRTSEQVSEIMKGVSSLVRHALPKGRFELERHPEKARTVRGKTIVVAALHAEDTASRNGADLMYRNIHLREHTSLAERISIHSGPGDKADAVEQAHRGPSPAAIRLAKLMLKLMVESSETIETASGKPMVDERRTYRDMLADGEAIAHPIVLRADAEAVARHMTLLGYSKAANTINDAVRYLAYELSSTTPQGQPLFARRQADGAVKPIAGVADIHPIIRKLGIIGINGPGVKLTDEEKMLGMYRLRFRNQFDRVAEHFDITTGTTQTVDEHDIVHTLKGTREGLGHLPRAALGFEEARGYIHDDPQAMKLLGGVLNRKYGVGEGQGAWTGSVTAPPRNGAMRS